MISAIVLSSAFSVSRMNGTEIPVRKKSEIGKKMNRSRIVTVVFEQDQIKELLRKNCLSFAQGSCVFQLRTA